MERKPLSTEILLCFYNEWQLRGVGGFGEGGGVSHDYTVVRHKLCVPAIFVIENISPGHIGPINECRCLRGEERRKRDPYINFFIIDDKTYAVPLAQKQNKIVYIS